MDDRPRSHLLLTDTELTGTDKVLLQLADKEETTSHASAMADVWG